MDAMHVDVRRVAERKRCDDATAEIDAVNVETDETEATEVD